jgi:hypothetical protein
MPVLSDTTLRRPLAITSVRAPRRRPRLRLYPPDDIRAVVPDDQWLVFLPALRAAQRLGIEFAIGGGLAVSFYTGYWRNSKDLDIYLLPADRERMIAAVNATGMSDYYEQVAYDRSWIYRAHAHGVIVDLIWAMANGSGNVDGSWLREGPVAVLRGEEVRLVAAEELFWSKAHVLQRDRCDWPDLLNLLYTAGPAFDWRRLLARCRAQADPQMASGPARDEYRLLASIVSLFSWVAPGRAADLPRWLWSELDVPQPAVESPVRNDHRIRLLDSRPWFTPTDIGPTRD